MGRFKSKSALTLPFFRKLYQLHNSGMSVGDAINLMTQRMSDPGLRELSEHSYKDLSEGRTLAVSMRAQPEVFDPMMAHLIEAGEATGNVVPILKNLIEHLERKAELKAKMISALVYPVFLIFVALGVVALFLFFLLPRIQAMLDSLGEKLNLAARVLIGFSDILLKDGPFVIGALALAFVMIMQWRKSEKGRYKTDQWLLKIPLIKSITYHSEICRVTNVLSILLGNGVNTTESLRLAENTVGNRILLERYQGARAMINDGAPFSVAFKKYQLLPDLDLDIISIGENTGSLVDGFSGGFQHPLRGVGGQVALRHLRCRHDRAGYGLCHGRPAYARHHHEHHECQPEPDESVARTLLFFLREKGQGEHLVDRNLPVLEDAELDQSIDLLLHAFRADRTVADARGLIAVGEVVLQDHLAGVGEEGHRSRRRCASS